jgi:hypothetical protein
MLFDIALHEVRLRLAAIGKCRIATLPREKRELRQHVIEEEAEPHAFPLALCADHVHAVIPVAAMLIEAGRDGGACRQVVIGVLFGAKRPALDERHRLVQCRPVTAGQHIAAQGQRQPQVVVAAARAHAATG